jgi:hypothetical protein
MLTTVAPKRLVRIPHQASMSVHVRLDIMEMENSALVSSLLCLQILRCASFDLHIKLEKRGKAKLPGFLNLGSSRRLSLELSLHVCAFFKETK